MLDVARDLARRRALLLDRRRDRGGDVVDLADRGRRCCGSPTTAVVVTVCMLTICWRISSVAFAVWLARLFTSEATTAKPRPASPARAASMVALSASRVGLRGDGLDQVDHDADARGVVGQPLHGGIGRAGLLDRLAGDFAPR